MKLEIVAICDEDTLIGKLPSQEVDLLLCLGDLWETTITRAIAHYPNSRTFAVKGNHDSRAPFPNGVEDLHLAVTEYEGVRFGGFKGCWQYKPRGHHLFLQWEVEEALRDFPAVDVFLAHNSPAGFHERDTDVHQGFSAFVQYIERTQPKYFFHGHQHISQQSMLGETQIVGIYGEARMTLDCSRDWRPVEHFEAFDFDDFD